jgi:hypothetical protein
MIAIPVDVYDNAGNMIKIEANDPSGNHIVDFLWDNREEQTSENRQRFREWAYEFLRENKGCEVHL